MMLVRPRSLSVVLIDERDEATSATERPRLSGNTKSLLMMFVLFTLITAGQWVGGLVAHSLALQADCASMAVDALSYLGNMLAECQSDRQSSTWTHVAASRGLRQASGLPMPTARRRASALGPAPSRTHAWSRRLPRSMFAVSCARVSNSA